MAKVTKIKSVAPAVLFVFGLVLELTGFFLGHAKEVPFTEQVIARGYVRARTALAEIGSDPIREGQPGFAELSDVVLDELRENNPPEVLRRVSIVEFIPGSSVSLSLLNAPIGQNKIIQVKFSNGQRLDSSIQELRLGVQKLRQRALFNVAIVIFSVGIVLQIIGFLLDKRRRSGVG